LKIPMVGYFYSINPSKWYHNHPFTRYDIRSYLNLIENLHKQLLVYPVALVSICRKDDISQTNMNKLFVSISIQVWI
jgi:hypothetical protein